MIPQASILSVVLVSVAVATWPSCCGAQLSDELETAFRVWARDSLLPLSDADSLESITDLQPLGEMLGDARIVALSEGLHAVYQPAAFRNRLFRYLVEDLGFAAIAIESGIVESKVLNDYVISGVGDFDDVVAQGFSWGFGDFRQNRELVSWIRSYNAGLPHDAHKVQIFGFDQSGSPGNLSVARTPETPVRAALEYLAEVDPQSAGALQRRLDPFVPILAGTDGYGTLSQVQRNELTAAIEDVISLVERKRLEYINKTSEYEYEWAARTAVAARQVDAWFRRMPLEWDISQGLEWARASDQIRERNMADNLDWILGQIHSDVRLFVFASVPHIASTPLRDPDWYLESSGDEAYEITPFGAFAKARYGTDFVNILNLLSTGEIAMCSREQPLEVSIDEPTDTWAESVFGSWNVPQYILDLRGAPPLPARWLKEERDNRSAHLSTSTAFDIVYYVESVTSDCVPRP